MKPNGQNGQSKPIPPRSVVVCLIHPNPGGITADTFATLFGMRDLYQKIDVPFGVIPVQGMSYEHALAEVAGRAMHWTETEDLFFLDTDIAFDPKWLALMCTMEEDIVCGTYQQRTSPDDWCLNTTQAGWFDEELRNDPVTGVQMLAIDDTGFGAVRIRRRCMEDLQRRYHDQLHYFSMFDEVGGPCYALWDPWIYELAGKRRRCAGDTNFFRRARESGYQPWALPQMPINHARMGLQSLNDWVAAQKAKLVSLEQAGGVDGTPCSKCGEPPAVKFTRDGKRICRRCAMGLGTEQLAPPPAPSSGTTLADKIHGTPVPDGPVDTDDGY